VRGEIGFVVVGEEYERYSAANFAFVMKTCSAFFVLLWLTSAAAQPAAPANTPIVAKSTYHPDNSHSETIVNKYTHELFESTYNAGGALVSKKHYLLNERGLPTQGHIYDGRGNLIARSQVYFDAYGRATEMRSFNLNGQCYQQVVYEYDARGVPKKPKVVNVNPGASPTIKPGVVDFTNTAAPGQMTAQPQQQQQAPAPETPQPKSFWKRVFGPKEKK
jgi:hypothetical protein